MVASITASTISSSVFWKNCENRLSLRCDGHIARRIIVQWYASAQSVVLRFSLEYLDWLHEPAPSANAPDDLLSRYTPKSVEPCGARRLRTTAPPLRSLFPDISSNSFAYSSTNSIFWRLHAWTSLSHLLQICGSIGRYWCLSLMHAGRVSWKGN